MKYADLIQLCRFPAVVQAADIQKLRFNPQSLEASEFVKGYLAADVRSRSALTELLASLHQTQTGGAFWLNGVFGSGKSHLLGLVTLLADGTAQQGGTAHADFLAGHPDMAPLLQDWPQRLVVFCGLEAYNGAQWSLEQVFWRELEAEWQRRGLGAFFHQGESSRGEAFASLEVALKARGLGGLVVCLDELSLFLGGKSHTDLQLDAAFLQFVGQHCQRAPLWFVAALQKSVDDIGGLESYSLTQIRDRFRVLSLGQTHLKAIILHRMVRPLEERKLEAHCDSTFLELQRVFPRLEFGPREWRAAFPFHPATLDLLEGVTGRFFSRTRSATQFCQGAVTPEDDASRRVGVEAIFDYFEPELETHPELRPVAAVWRTWEQSAPLIAGPDGNAEQLLRVMKAMLVWKMAGLAATPLQIGNALGLDAQLGGEGNYEFMRHLLERIRTRSSFLVVDRGDEPYLDRYSVDLGQRIAEMARRHIRASLETFSPQDTRVSLHALECCRQEPLPLHEYKEARSLPIFWNNAPRRILVEVYLGGSVQTLVNRVASLREPGAQEDGLLLILPPFGVQELDQEEVNRRMDAQLAALLWVWRPRVPLRDEWEVAREAASAALLETDPVLEDNRRGRALLDYLKKEGPGRNARVARLALRLLREGQVDAGLGTTIDAAELVRGETWPALVESVAGFGLHRVFQGFEKVAPRARLLTPSNAEALCLEILRRPSEDSWYPASMERLARHLAEPLGLAKAVAGRWQIGNGERELGAQVLAATSQGATYGQLEHMLAKGPWGLRPEQTALLICGLLRSGELVALDSRGQELSPRQVGMPLRRSIHSLRAGQLATAEAWGLAKLVLGLFTAEAIGPLSFSSQERLRSLAAVCRESLEADASLARARVAQLRRQLDHNEALWPQWEQTCQDVGDLLQAMGPVEQGGRAVTALAALPLEKTRQTLKNFRQGEAGLEQNLAILLRGHALLSHGSLQVDGKLKEERSRLLLRFQAGESVVWDAELMEGLRQFTAEYHAAYKSWHQAQHNPSRWNSLRRITAAEEFLALERLATLIHRPFPQAEQIKALLSGETAKCCVRSGDLEAGEAVCSACQLPLAQRLRLPDVGALQSQIVGGISQFERLVNEPEVAKYLDRVGNPLAKWDGDATGLLQLLGPESLRSLDDALRPRRTVTRSRAALLAALGAQTSVAEYKAAFLAWLEAGDHTAPEDEVTLED